MKIYRDNLKKYNDRFVKLSHLFNRLSFLRLFIFIISAILLIYLFQAKLFTPILIAFPLSIFCFGAIINYHNKIAFLKRHTAFLKEINESEILRETCTLEKFDSGQKFINQNHPYTSDLDIFGSHSILQLVNRTTTESGMILLSEWLSQPAPNHEIHDRQNAIKELAQKLDWRQDFQASGMHYKTKKNDYNKLLDWVEAPFVLLKHRRMYIAVAIILSILSSLALYFLIINATSSRTYIYLFCFVAVLVVNYIILRKVKDIADDIVKTSQDNINTFKGYQALINKVQIENFSSKKLCALQSMLIENNFSASSEINRLCRLLEFSQQRGIRNKPIGRNYFYTILNGFLLLDIYLIIEIEKWKSKNKKFLKSWAATVSEFEAINSLAGFCYSNPSYAFPEITEKYNYVHFELIGHPLINANKRVCNNFHMDGQGEVIMITGSNMGGKSTFLRTVGVNLVLALAGAPCCAKSAQVSNLKLYTSMRTQDNLRDGTSSFYAELHRVEEMLELIQSSPNVFYLLDEMFKGTNSEDRHKGGFSLINQLTNLKASGIIATHDIKLAKLLGNKLLVKNYSFNSEIKDHSMLFSYKLEPGICHDFNASELMKWSGIKILSHIPDEPNP